MVQQLTEIDINIFKTKKETYYSNGVMSSELHFRFGILNVKHGLNRGWYEDGSRGFEFSYKDGKLIKYG